MTETPTDKNVMLALLALDAYSRGDNPQVTDKDGNELSNRIGNAQVDKLSSDVLDGTASISGFSATSYKWTVGGTTETVIAYRGTDFITNGGWPSIETLKDIIAGWSSSFGMTGDDTGVPIVHLQPYYAEEFYKNVTGHEVFPDGTPAMTIMTRPHRQM
ncbi:hypothetical protein MF410_00100 (plasmid) [Rhizobium sp. C104]|uniref:hypothetical protein n=1 Tax=Rhizobium sp. C104 TaxID=2917727 RepID=UPI001EF879DA|nr:hypothetical protein [Rhizobium sp. C104]ULJ76829.1 hypothetical protein MF410_00100 [Rhizobium sp. C104]